MFQINPNNICTSYITNLYIQFNVVSSKFTMVQKSHVPNGKPFVFLHISFIYLTWLEMNSICNSHHDPQGLEPALRENGGGSIKIDGMFNPVAWDIFGL